MANQFNGSDQYLSTSSTPITSGTGNVTMACWFSSFSTTTPQVLMAIDNMNGNGRYFLRIESAVDGNTVRAFCGNASVLRNAQTSSGYSANTPTHACATYTGLASRSAYINGGSKGVNSDAATFSSAPTRITIGALNYTGNVTQSPINGLIAEAAIWNVVLTDEEILSLANGFTPDQVRPQSLQFYAPLIRDLQDLRAARALTNNNSAVPAVHPRIIT